MIALLVLAAVAAPPSFGRRAPWAIGVDHLAGVVHLEHLAEGLTPSREGVSQTSLGLLGGGLVPRIAVHRFFAGCSLGLAGQFAVARFGNQGVFTFGLAPRFGIVAPLATDLVLWLRAGPTYLRSSVLGGSDRGAWSLAMGGEALLVWSPLPALSLTLGPFLEAGLAGTESFEPLTRSDGLGNVIVESEAKVRTRMFGVSLGAYVDL